MAFLGTRAALNDKEANKFAGLSIGLFFMLEYELNGLTRT